MQCSGKRIWWSKCALFMCCAAKTGDTPSPPANRFLLLHTTRRHRRHRRLEAVRKGNAAVGVRGTDTVVLGVEKKSTPKLQDSRSVRKIASLDTHVALACVGLKADTRVLINRARVECQSHRFTVEDPITVEYITRYIVGLQQKYTQSGGVRPFGLSTLIVGFDPYTDKPALYQTDPSGTFSAWKANATRRNSNSTREFLEKNYKDTSGKETIKLTIRALLEVTFLLLSVLFDAI
ncbi:proteasome subunit alpha type-7-A-like [Hordeum vulgare subsp. vulgare]|uniref:proteasome subunit alpha type-7-A-like n=1 Tax=Hordeum vulgare subsp. vulgare TaxID=112509 RepID=UPI001D1A3A3D|nr:proteasome subunit alpha type-7-A-like [Hordeum vulgare subsp. vulgare]